MTLTDYDTWGSFLLPYPKTWPSSRYFLLDYNGFSWYYIPFAAVLVGSVVGALVSFAIGWIRARITS